MLTAGFSHHNKGAAVMTYEAVQVLIPSGDSSGRGSRSASRRFMVSLSQYMRRYSRKNNHDPL